MHEYQYDDRTEEERLVSQECFLRLSEAALKLKNQGIIPPRAIATSFMSAGIGTALQSFGWAQTVEWLRDISDAIEAENIERPKH